MINTNPIFVIADIIMNQLLIVLVGLFAIGNAAIVYRVAPVDQFVAPAIVPSVVSSIIPTVIPETEIADWEAYKVRFE